MARGTTLGNLVTQLRVQLGHSTNPAVGSEFLDNIKEALRVAQKELWDEHDWRFLRVRKDKTINAGQRYYDFPTDMSMDGVESVSMQWGSEWIPVEQGIEPEHYSAFDSDNDERSDPILRWDVIDTGTLQFEVWPLPATASTIRFMGKKSLGALTSETDTADLDDRLIVLKAAVALETSEAKVKRLDTLFGRRMTVVKGRLTSKERFNMGGPAVPPRRRGSVVVVSS